MTQVPSPASAPTAPASSSRGDARWRPGAVVLACLVLSLAACGGTGPSGASDGSARPATATGTPTSPTATPTATPVAAVSLPAGVKAYRNLEFVPGSTPRGRLMDLYVPPATDTPAPVVLWTHGSGWLATNGRDDTAAIAAAFTARGYAVAGFAVRSSDSATFPAQVWDAKAAIRWVRANAAKYRLDPTRVGLMGDSSGGWTALMTAYSAGLDSLEGQIGVQGQDSSVRAVVAWYAPADFRTLDTAVPDRCVQFNRDFGLQDCHSDARSPESRLLGCPITSCTTKARQASPVNYVSKGDPPTLLLHGGKDLTVPYAQSRALFDKLAAACLDVSLITLPRAAHSVHLSALTDDSVRAGAQKLTAVDCRAGDPDPVTPTWDTLLEFFDVHVAS